MPLSLGVKHGPEAYGHVGGPGNKETRTDHQGHLGKKSRKLREERSYNFCSIRTLHIKDARSSAPFAKKMAPQVQQNFDAELEWKELIKALPKELNQENSSIETQNISKPLFF